VWAVGPIVATQGPGTDDAGTDDAPADDAPADDTPDGSVGREAVDFYWRPGCGYSMALERALDKRDVATRKHNIWEDAEAAAFVRLHADGAETVPTVAVGATVLVNPTADEVVTAMGGAGMSPGGAQAAAPSGLGRLLSRVLGG